MRSLPYLFAVSFAFGCGGGGGGGSGALDDLDESSGTEEDMRVWIESASAPAIYAQAMMPTFAAGLTGDTACPVIVESETSTTYDGGCTDMQGNEWIGHAEATGSQTSGEGRIVYDGFGFVGDSEDCPGMRTTTLWHGTIIQTASTTGTSITFSIDMRMDIDGPAEDTCEPLVGVMGIDYSGTMTQEGEANIFSGSGRIGTSEHGVISVSTDDEVVDDTVCGDEAASGSTTLSASGHTAVVTYDGATDCDPESTVTWSYDGTDMGEMTGVACNAGGSGGAAGSLVLIGLALAGVVRRRR
jgi:uncharacterized protein (TIGR03382 family)